MSLTLCSLILDCGVVPLGSGAYPYFVAVQSGLTSATCICLMINGFVGFQLYEDGTTLSVWLLRVCSISMFVISFAVALLTFKGWAGLGPTNTVGLFVVLYIFNAVFLFIYVVMQVLLVMGTLQDRWPLGHIAFGVFFFVIGQVLLYCFSRDICEGVQHYLDGMLFGTVCNLLGVMMVYKVRNKWLSVLYKPLLTILRSTGTLSQRKISSSLLVRDRTTGKSRSFCRTRTISRGTLSTRRANTRTACSTSLLSVARPMAVTNRHIGN